MASYNRPRSRLPFFHNKHISSWHSRNSNTSYSFVHSICLREKSKWKQIKERLLKFPKLLDVIDSFFPAHLILVSYFNFRSSVAAVLRTTQRYVCHEARRRSLFSFLNTISFILNFWKPYDPNLIYSSRLLIYSSRSETLFLAARTF